MAVGAGMSIMLQEQDKVCLGFFGDGSTNNGVFGESLNMAAMSQFETGVPVLFLIENNQFGMSGRGAGEVTGIDFIARRGWGYKMNGMHAEVVNGMDVLAVRDAVARASAICRAGDGPVLVEMMTYRYKGHSLSDQNAYRTEEEIDAWECEDPIGRMKQEMVKAGVLEPEQLDELEQAHNEQMEKITLAAARSEYPDPKDILEGLFSDTSCDTVPAEFRTAEGEYNQDAIREYRAGKGRMPQRRALLEAMTEEMIRDKRVVMYGEDVADYGGAFAVTAGLLDIFGRKRVFNAAISEATIPPKEEPPITMASNSCLQRSRTASSAPSATRAANAGSSSPASGSG